MGFPRDKGEFYLDTDASDYQIGAVLSQMQDGLRFCHPLIFMLSIDLAQIIQMPTACRDATILEIINVMKQTILNI